MYLLDTDTVIYALKGDHAVTEHIRENERAPMALSVISYGELRYGAAKSARPSENLARVRRIAELFPIFGVTRGVMETFGELKAELETRGRRLDDFDLIIAATALGRGCTLVTNNERHFRRVPGLPIENWS